MGNLQGTYDFLLFCTEIKITHVQFTDLPTPPHIDQQVTTMTKKEKRKQGFLFEDQNDMELPTLGDQKVNNMSDDTSAAGVNNLANLANHPYLANNQYWDLVDNDENKGNDDNYDDTDNNNDIKIVANPVPSAYRFITDVNKEVTVVADREITGAATENNAESTGVEISGNG